MTEEEKKSAHKSTLNNISYVPVELFVLPSSFTVTFAF